MQMPGVCRWIPFLSPAIHENKYRDDASVQMARFAVITVVALGAIAALVLAEAQFPAALLFRIISPGLACVCTILAAVAAMALDIWMTNNAIHAKAVDDYMRSDTPSEATTQHIRTYPKAAQLLVARHVDLNKKDSRGESLIDFVPVEIYALFVANGATKQNKHFHYAVAKPDPANLRCLLESKVFSPSDFTADEQVSFWRIVGSLEAAQLLIAYGFDVNIRDKGGYTPLLSLVQQTGDSSLVKRVNILLECGADKTLTLDMKRKDSSAVSLCVQPSIMALLEPSRVSSVMDNIKLVSYTGQIGTGLILEIAKLRMEVFHEFPFLYEGEQKYELRYLKKLFHCQDVIVIAAFDNDAVIGIATGFRFEDEADDLQQVFRSTQRDPKDYFCYGEVVLQPPYRGRGIGKQLVEKMEAHVRQLDSHKGICLYTSGRSLDDPRRPADYRPVGPFWKRQGFVEHPELIGQVSYKEIGEEQETLKPVIFWIKDLHTVH